MTHSSTVNWIATHEFDLRASDGSLARSSVKIGQPYLVSEQHWVCPVDLGRPYGRTADIVGVDSMQALSLALQFVARMVHSLVEAGYRIEEDGIVLSLDDILRAYFGRGS